MPIVSVIICAYNHEKYVYETIQSVLAQSFSHFELIILDNGSTDKTAIIIKKIQDKRIKYYSFKKNRGFTYALNYCLRKSKGQYIALCSSDDIWRATKLQKQIQYLDTHTSVGAVFSQVQVIDEDSRLMNHQQYEKVFNQQNRPRYAWLRRFFYEGNCLCFPSAVIRKTIYKKTQNENECLAQLHDFDLWVRICLSLDIYIFKERLVRFRIRNNETNMSSNTIQNKVRSMFEFAHVLPHYLNIKTIEEFLHIFPHAQKQHGDITNQRLIPFYVAREALDAPHDFHHRFALDTLFQLLQNPLLAAKIRKKSHFDYPDFITLTGKCDIHHVQHIQYQEDKIQQMKKEIERRK